MCVPCQQAMTSICASAVLYMRVDNIGQQQALQDQLASRSDIAPVSRQQLSQFQSTASKCVTPSSFADAMVPASGQSQDSQQAAAPRASCPLSWGMKTPHCVQCLSLPPETDLQ